MIDITNKKLLVIAPHPDDEIFGCGGLMYRVKEGGGSVYVLYLTVGATKDFSKSGLSTSDERLQEIKNVAKKMQLDGYHLAFPGDEYMLQLDQLSQRRIINEIERGPVSLENIQPDIIAFPSWHDYNQDHRAANEAALAATRPVEGMYKHVPELILEYELPYTGWGPGEARAPNFFVSLEKDALRAKLSSLGLYKSQMKTATGPVSVYASEELTKMRGVLAGVENAEAYVLRRINV
jgi:LmbE family N-acetylglucosaminyl deacetylase